jgi:CRP-like cAMP-binding protein
MPKLSEQEAHWLQEFGLAKGRQHIRVQHLRSEDVLFEIGEPARRVFLLLDGQIKVVATGSNGRSAVHEVIGPHGWLASEAMTGLEFHEHTAIATSQTEVLAFDQPHFWTMLDEHAPLRSMFVRGIALNLHEKGRMLDDALLSPAPIRLARLMLDWFRGKEANVIDLRTTQDRLAETIGVTRQTINSSIKAFTDLGILTRQGRNHYRLHKVALEVFLSNGGSKQRGTWNEVDTG